MCCTGKQCAAADQHSYMAILAVKDNTKTIITDAANYMKGVAKGSTECLEHIITTCYRGGLKYGPGDADPPVWLTDEWSSQKDQIIADADKILRAKGQRYHDDELRVSVSTQPVLAKKL
jgi:hypothetical protein